MFNLDPKTKKLVNFVGKIFLGIVVVGVMAWFLVINPYLISQEKKRFEAASAELEILAQEIQNKIGPAQDVKEENSCDRPNLKYTKGPLSCNVSLKAYYGDTTQEEATELMNTTSSLFIKPIRQGMGFNSVSREMNIMNFYQNNPHNFRSFYQKLENIQGLSCSVAYEYSSINSPKFIVSLGCGSPSRYQHFQLAN